MICSFFIRKGIESCWVIVCMWRQDSAAPWLYSAWVETAFSRVHWGCSPESWAASDVIKEFQCFQVLPLTCFPGLESPTMKKNNVRIWENDLEFTLLCRPCLCAVSYKCESLGGLWWLLVLLQRTCARLDPKLLLSDALIQTMGQETTCFVFSFVPGMSPDFPVTIWSINNF